MDSRGNKVIKEIKNNGLENDLQKQEKIQSYIILISKMHEE